MRRCVGASSPTIRQRSTPSRERGAARWDGSMPAAPRAAACPGLALSACASNRKIDVQSRRDCCPNFAASDGTKPSWLLLKAKPRRRARGSLCGISVHPAIARPFNTATRVSFRRLCTSEIEISECAITNVKHPKSNAENRLAAKAIRFAPYACKTTRNPLPAHLTGTVRPCAYDQKISRTQSGRL